MKLGIIKERKSPPDKRVVLSPQMCRTILDQFPEITIVVESSNIRCYTDKAYITMGIPVTTNMEDCDILIGVKEVPVNALIPGKKYFFFSHTIKKQPYNRSLLQAILKKNIELYDHELITSPNGTRLVAFGRYAGIVGAYNGIRAYGLKSDTFHLPKAETLADQQALITELRNIRLPATLKILLTGKGRVGSGVLEMLNAMAIKSISPEAYLEQEFKEPVYCQIDVTDYNTHKSGKPYPKEDFYAHPENYISNFIRFTKITDLYISGHFFSQNAPLLFTQKDTTHPEFAIKVVADISCDIDGPIASTIRATTIADPIYGYDPQTGSETDFKAPHAIAVMAVDNLPCELPKDASDGFGILFTKYIIPAFFNGDADGILQRARMTKNGKLTKSYYYLKDFVDGKE